MIPTFFNAMMTIMLANWALNDLPHAVGLLGNRYDEPATPGQIQYIAVLCQQLKITRPYEEQMRTFGEAGRMIRELETEREHRKKLESGGFAYPTKEDLGLGPLYHGTTVPRAESILTKGLELSEDGIVWLAYSYADALDRAKELSLEVGEPPAVLVVNLPGKWPLERAETGVYLSHRPVPARYIKSSESGNPDNIRLERTSINTKTLDDLEATWRRIESDMSYRMQSALGILKEVMGHYYEQPAVATYEDSNLVGIAVYGVVDDVDLGTRDIHLCELASFTYEPGVGRMLVDEVVKIAREMHVDSVTVSYGPGVRGFYEKLGFISDYKEGGGIKVGGNPDAATVVLYHGTSKEIATKALREGLEPQPGIETEFPSIYLAYNPDDAAKYGEVVLRVELPEEELTYMQETIPGYMRTTYPIEPRHISIHSGLLGKGPDTAVGTCYEDAWRFILKEEAGYLVHGTVYSPGLRKRVSHAWVETDAGYIWEPQTKGYYTVVGFEEVAAPVVEHRYTTEEAAIMAARTIGIHPYGPWTDEERAKWLGTTPR